MASERYRSQVIVIQAPHQLSALCEVPIPEACPRCGGMMVPEDEWARCLICSERLFPEEVVQ